MKAVVSDITEYGFKLHVKDGHKYDKMFNVSRDTFAWFLGATDEELLDVTASAHYEDTDEHGHCISWDKLDVWLGHLDFEHPEERFVYQASAACRERYYAKCPKKEG
jgi:hypothetical protein